MADHWIWVVRVHPLNGQRTEGKRHTQADIALARRRLNVLWDTLRDNAVFGSTSQNLLPQPLPDHDLLPPQPKRSDAVIEDSCRPDLGTALFGGPVASRRHSSAQRQALSVCNREWVCRRAISWFRVLAGEAEQDRALCVGFDRYGGGVAIAFVAFSIAAMVRGVHGAVEQRCA